MADTIEHTQVNEALVRFVQSQWSHEIEQEIRYYYGPAIAQQAKVVYQQALDCPIDWSRENMDSALAILADFMTAQFPWLCSEARTRLNYCYILAWK